MELLAGTQRNGQQQVFKVPTIRIHVPLDQPTVNVNFTALAEEKYGWDALHPVAARLKALNRYESDEESDSEAAQGEHQPVRCPPLEYSTNPDFRLMGTSQRNNQLRRRGKRDGSSITMM